jgi:hypothetical protein
VAVCSAFQWLQELVTWAICMPARRCRPSEFAAGARPAAAIDRPAILSIAFRHDVSILITVRIAVGRFLGMLPGSSTSMMCMRPPQHGHGVGSTRGSSAPGAAMGSGFGAGGATASN